MLFKVKIKSTAEEKIKMKKYYDCYVEVTLQHCTVHAPANDQVSNCNQISNMKYHIFTTDPLY